MNCKQCIHYEICSLTGKLLDDPRVNCLKYFSFDADTSKIIKQNRVLSEDNFKLTTDLIGKTIEYVKLYTDYEKILKENDELKKIIDTKEKREYYDSNKLKATMYYWRISPRYRVRTEQAEMIVCNLVRCLDHIQRALDNDERIIIEKVKTEGNANG